MIISRRPGEGMRRLAIAPILPVLTFALPARGGDGTGALRRPTRSLDYSNGGGPPTSGGPAACRPPGGPPPVQAVVIGLTEEQTP
jgi:hypothetical protein